MSKVRDGLAELSGIHLCEAPGCTRQLKGNQGKIASIGGREVKTCYSSSCVDWVSDQRRIAQLQ
jgi:hypothetical protein